jgi:hypothetical protein
MDGDMTREAGRARGARTGRDPGATFAGRTPLGTAGEPVARPPAVDPSARFRAEIPFTSSTRATRTALPALVAPALPLGERMAQEHASRRERATDSSRVGLTRAAGAAAPAAPLSRATRPERAGAATAGLERLREAGAVNDAASSRAIRPAQFL